MRRWLRVVAAILGVMIIAPSASPRGDATRPDWLITYNARRVLWAEPIFAELNLGVRVRDGVALAWGPVLSDEQAAEVIARLKLVPGVTTVTSELYVLPAGDLLRQRFQPPPPKQATSFARPIEEPAKGPAVRPLPSQPSDLIEDLRNRERRFKGLEVKYSNGVVTISGEGARAGDAMDFAHRVRQLPGVTNVVLKSQ